MICVCVRRAAALRRFPIIVGVATTFFAANYKHFLELLHHGVAISRTSIAGCAFLRGSELDMLDSKGASIADLKSIHA